MPVARARTASPRLLDAIPKVHVAFNQQCETYIWQRDGGRTLPNDIPQQIIRVEQARGPAGPRARAVVEHGAREDEDPVCGGVSTSKNKNKRRGRGKDRNE